MSRQFSGFEKSAPSSKISSGTHPTQGPTSSWDVDLTPVEKMLENHTQNTNRSMENLFEKIGELVDKTTSTNNEDQILAIMQKMAQMQGESSQYLEKIVHVENKIEKNSSHLLEVGSDVRKTLANSEELVSTRHEDMIQIFSKMLHFNERMAVVLERCEVLLQENKELLQQQKDPQNTSSSKENIVFWVFISITLLFFFLQFILPKYF